MIKSIVMISVLSAFLCGCAEVTFNIVGELSSGEPMTGSGVAKVNGVGSIEVLAKGVSCSGTYSSYSFARELTVPLQCENGITGVAHVSRDPGLTSGTGTFRMSEGTTGTFAYGD